MSNSNLFKETEHFLKRKNNRGLTNAMIDVIIAFGEEKKAPGGANKYFLSKKKAQKEIEKIQAKINLLEKAKGKTLVVENSKVITGY